MFASTSKHGKTLILRNVGSRSSWRGTIGTSVLSDQLRHAFQKRLPTVNAPRPTEPIATASTTGQKPKLPVVDGRSGTETTLKRRRALALASTTLPHIKTIIIKI